MSDFRFGQGTGGGGFGNPIMNPPAGTGGPFTGLGGGGSPPSPTPTTGGGGSPPAPVAGGLSDPIINPPPGTTPPIQPVTPAGGGGGDGSGGNTSGAWWLANDPILQQLGDARGIKYHRRRRALAEIFGTMSQRNQYNAGRAEGDKTPYWLANDPILSQLNPGGFRWNRRRRTLANEYNPPGNPPSVPPGTGGDGSDFKKPGGGS